MRRGERCGMERVRREIALGCRFDEAEFAAAFASFRKLYNTGPQRVACAPDVLDRFCVVFAKGGNGVHAAIMRYDDVPVVAAVLRPGIVAIEGEVSSDRMGDW